MSSQSGRASTVGTKLTLEPNMPVNTVSHSGWPVWSPGRSPTALVSDGVLERTTPDGRALSIEGVVDADLLDDATIAVLAPVLRAG